MEDFLRGGGGLNAESFPLPPRILSFGWEIKQVIKYFLRRGYWSGGILPGGILSRGIVSGGYCLGGYCPRTLFTV